MDGPTDAGGEPQPLAVDHDGFLIAGLDWGGDGPPLLLLHPNGFCAGVFDPLARRLQGEYRVIGVDLRGHGGSDAPTALDQCDYRAVAGDALAVLDALGIDECLVLGESLGGSATILLDELRPGVVRRMLLCEPIAFPEREGRAVGSPLAAMARRRRVVWPDRPTVSESYGSRPPMNVMEPAALAGYVRWGFRDRDDGQVELACPPEVEAWYFDGGAGGVGPWLAFAHLASLHAPATLLCGDATDLPAAMFNAQAEAMGAARTCVAGSHFFLQESAARAADLVREHLPW